MCISEIAVELFDHTVSEVSEVFYEALMADENNSEVAVLSQRYIKASPALAFDVLTEEAVAA